MKSPYRGRMCLGWVSWWSPRRRLDAIAGGICSGFHYLFPGSRHLYVNDFKNQVFVIVCELLLGLKLCPVSVQMMRKQFFPEDILDDIGEKSTDEMFENVSYGIKQLGELKNDLNLDLYSIPLRVHQIRKSFNAAQLSPLMKEYLATKKEGLKTPCNLRRTIPVSSCLVGGENTYKKIFSKKDHAIEFAEMSAAMYEDYRRDINTYQKNAHHAIKLIDETKDIVLNGGKSAIRAYKSILASRSILEEIPLPGNKYKI